MLDVVIRKVSKIHISHNCIHMYLKATGLANEDPKKKNRHQWVRYEREHRLSAGHIDWHESGWSDLKVCVIIDDASRMILAGGEFKNVNTENSKLVVNQLVERYWCLCPIRALIMDHGSEFDAHRVHKDGNWDLLQRLIPWSLAVSEAPARWHHMVVEAGMVSGSPESSGGDIVGQLPFHPLVG
jgi:putative transposase